MSNYFERFHQQQAIRPIIQDPIGETRLPTAQEELRGKGLQNQKTEQDIQLEPQRVAIAARAQAVAEQNSTLARQRQEADLQATRTDQNRQGAQWDEFGNIINSLTDQYNKNFKGSGGSSGRGRLAEVMPGNMFGMTANSANDVFDSTAMRAGPFLKTIMFPGSKDTDAAAEYKQKIMPFIPVHGDSDEKMADKIKQLRRIYEGQAKATGRLPSNAPRKGGVDDILKKYGVK